MAITLNIAKCKKGWGVYVRALSGQDLLVLAPSCEESVVRVTSGRLARKRSKQSAKNFVARFLQEPSEKQHERLKNCWIRIAEKDYKVVKVQNLVLFREFEGRLVRTFGTTDREYAERVALYYQERGLKSFLRKSVTKYIKLPLNTDTNDLNKI